MKKHYIIITIIFIVLVASLIYKKAPVNSDLPILEDGKTYNRIISLSPNITEILFELGLENKIVGVTNYCTYPEAAKKIAKIGGYFDPNFEAIVSLKPDLVLILPEQENVKQFLAELNLQYLIINNKTVSDIFAGIKTIGNTFEKAKLAKNLLFSLKSRLEKIKGETKNSDRPGVLISVGRALGTGGLADVYAAGKDTYFDELIKLAGAKNVVEINNIAYPLLSAEGIIYLNPDIIVDFATDFEKQNLDEYQVINDWDALPDVNAVKNHRIYVRGQSYAVIPGPRFIILLEDMAQIFHPEIEWEEK
ncbi:ABC transporter substrate-binding protein [candidate division KSB1 bacterium]|nr:ABC transporter substrate-binding protein [candidate division KSB1 bacterium]